MALLSVSAEGRITLTRDLLRHLGVKPGEKVDLEKLPTGALRLRAPRQTGTIEDFFRVLDGRRTSEMPVTIEEMNTIAIAGWAGQQGNKR